MKTKHLLVGCLLVWISIFTTMNAQVFQPLGTGLSSNYLYGSVIHENQGNVYVFHDERTYNPYVRTPLLKKWDGFSWSTLPPIPHQTVRSIHVFNGDLYIASDDWGNTGNLYKFDGTGWVSQLANFSGYIVDMEVDNGTLICVGAFSVGSPAQYNVLGYDGVNVVSMPSLAMTDSIADVNIIQNEVWVAGDFQQSNFQGDSVDVKKLTNGTTWERPAAVFKVPSHGGWGGSMYSVFEYNGKTYCGGYNGLFEITNDTAYTVDNTYGVFQYAEFDGFMYLVSGGYGGLTIFNGSTVSPLAISPQEVFSVTANSTHLYATFGDTTKINGIDFGYILEMGQQSFGMLQGKVFADENANCIYDAGTDNPLLHTILGMLGINYTAADVNGNYSLYLPPGSYSLQQPASIMNGRKYYTLSCGTSLNVSITAGQTTQKDIIFAHDGSVDVGTSVYMYLGNRSRQGFTETGKLIVRNPGVAITSPLSVTLTIPSTVSFMASTTTPSSVSGNDYTFTFPSMAQSSATEITFQVKIDLASNSIDDTLRFYSQVGPLAADVDVSNDKDTTWTRVVGACDPNDKTPSVEQSLPGLSRLDYHIRFQNTGTDTAYTVKIVDTLESYFAPASITINAASHDYSFHISDNNVIAWTFDNILLPDSGANYEGSQGFVNFSIDLDPGLQVGDIIDNDAEIYFDFQPPVHTNHAQTAIVWVLGVEEFLERQTSLSVYPNPAQAVFYIENSLDEKQEVKLIDATGRIIRNLELQPEMKAEVRTGSLSPGMYFINNGANTHRVIITP